MRCPQFAKDMNFDGIYTITDLWLQAVWIFCLPGNLLLNLIMSEPSWRTFWEVSPASCSNAGTAVFSFMAWFVLLSILGASSAR
jgi:hypothetical protein